MKICKYVALLCILVLMTACAVLDTTNFDTARSLGENRYEWMIGHGKAIDMNRMVYTPYEDDETFNGVQAQDDHMVNVRYNRGLSASTDLQFSTTLPTTFSAKVAFKKRLNAEDQKVMLAVKPAVFFATGSKPRMINLWGDETDPGEDWTYANLGGEISLYITLSHEFLTNTSGANTDKPRISMTLAPKLMFSSLSYKRATDEDPIDRGTYRSLIPVVSVTPELRWRGISLRPELTGYMVKVKNGKTTLLGSVNYGIAMEYGK